MKLRKANLALAIGIFMMSVSGCASLSLQPDKAELPVASKAESLDIQFGLARLLERNGKLEEAREAYLEILSLQPHTQSLHRLGVTAIRQNRLNAGLSHLSEAVEAGNPTAELLGDFGYAQFLAGDLTGAEATLTQAVRMDPSQKRNLNNLAIVFGKQDRLNESFQLFRQANPEAEALSNLAFIQAQSNDLGQAQINYNRALDLDPELKVAAVGLLEVHKHLRTQSESNVEHVPDRHVAQVAQSQPRELTQEARSERLPLERASQEEISQERIAQERIASERIAQERVAQERITQERMAQERIAQERSAQVRLAAAPVAQSPPRDARSSQTQATDRIAATMQRPLRLHGRTSGNSRRRISSRKSNVQSAGQLGVGALQPPAFPKPSSSGTIALASYEEAIVDQPPPQTSN